MANIAVSRIKREYKEVIQSQEFSDNQFELDLVDKSFTHLRGVISGPGETPYDGGKFVLDIIVPDTYPFNPPKVKFITKIWHPNISSVTGAICLDILKDQWAAAMTIRTVLISIQALLSAAEPDDPQDAVVASQYKSNYSVFVETAAYWTRIYAGGTKSVDDCEKKVTTLMCMGFDEEQSRTALSESSWNVDTAIESLINSS